MIVVLSDYLCDRRPVSRSQLNIEKEFRAVNEKAASLIECMVRYGNSFCAS